MNLNCRFTGAKTFLIFLTAAVIWAGFSGFDNKCLAGEPADASEPADNNGAASAPALPAASAAPSESFLKGITVNGLVDVYYDHNFNRPQSDLNQLRAFDIHNDELRFNMGKVAVERLPAPFGFRADFVFGDTAKLVNSMEPGGTHLLRFMEQLYVSYKAPLGRGLTLDFGKFVTPHGAEVIESKDNWNYSRSLLFSWAIPFYHFGGRARYAFNDKVSVAAFVTNGWNDVIDNNEGKTYGFQAALNPTKKISIVQNYMTGPEQSNNDSDWRHLWDTTATYTAGSHLSLMANYDFGMDRISGARVRWQGVAGYARVQVTPWFAISPRLEWYDDPQGFTTGVPQAVKEGTITTEFAVRKGLLLRGEYRHDWSDQPVFERHDGSFVRDQRTATIGVIYFISLRH